VDTSGARQPAVSEFGAKHVTPIWVQVRDSKLVADREARSARGQTAHLEQELSFYQAQSASAMVTIVAAYMQMHNRKHRRCLVTAASCALRKALRSVPWHGGAG
jgi:hypothetical protein